MKTNKTQRPVRVAMIALGCAKNMVDAEIMLGLMIQNGIEITNDAASADVLIVNTCSFIGDAKEESVDAILESVEARNQNNPNQGMIVAGCLPQRYREELVKLVPEVDAFIGVNEVPQIVDIIGKIVGKRGLAARKSVGHKPADDSAILSVTRTPAYIPDHNTPRFRLTPAHFAYVKIAEGCNHPCSFCVIPRIRGRHRSRTQNDIVEEARKLVDEGVKEINLISQDSTFYGMDLARGKGTLASPDRFQAATKELPANASTLSSLLRQLNELPGDFWIRVLYTHPAHWTDELIQTMADCSKVARYVDIPLQHIDADMLTRMRRETSRKHIEDLLMRIRKHLPGITLRTTFIVGFPGETEKRFETLIDFIREFRFERLGVFAFSPEEGTVAAKMSGKVPEAVRLERKNLAMAVQHKIARSIAAAQVGRKIRVLVDGKMDSQQQASISSWEHGFIREEEKEAPMRKGSWMIARSQGDAPDIDGRVYINGRCRTGAFANVTITGHGDYDLIAKTAGK